MNDQVRIKGWEYRGDIEKYHKQNYSFPRIANAVSRKHDTSISSETVKKILVKMGLKTSKGKKVNPAFNETLKR